MPKDSAISSSLSTALNSGDNDAFFTQLKDLPDLENLELTFNLNGAGKTIDFQGKGIRKLTISGGFEFINVSNLTLGCLEFAGITVKDITLRSVQIEIVEFNSVRFNNGGSLSIEGIPDRLSRIDAINANSSLKAFSSLKISHSKIGAIMSLLAPLSSLEGRHSIYTNLNLTEITAHFCSVSFSNCAFQNTLVRGTSIAAHEKPWRFENCYFHSGLTISDSQFNSEVYIESSRNLALHKQLIVDSEPAPQCNLTLDRNTFQKQLTVKGAYSNISVDFRGAGHFSTMDFQLDKLFLTDEINIGGIRDVQQEIEAKITIDGGLSKALNILAQYGEKAISLLCKNHETKTFTVDRTHFSSIKIANSKIFSSILTKVKFGGPVRFEGVTFEEPPVFKDSNFYFDTSFIKCAFKNRHKETVGSYRELKNLSKRIENEVDHLKFSSLELEARYEELLHTKSNLEDWFELTASFLYKAVNDRGDNLIKPFLWIIFFFGFFGIIYFASMSPHINPVNLSQTPPWDIGPNYDGLSIRTKAMIVSATSSLGPFRLFLPSKIIDISNAMIQLAVFVQLMLSSILWFFFIFGIRRRFKVT